MADPEFKSNHPLSPTWITQENRRLHANNARALEELRSLRPTRDTDPSLRALPSHQSDIPIPHTTFPLPKRSTSPIPPVGPLSHLLSRDKPEPPARPAKAQIVPAQVINQLSEAKEAAKRAVELQTQLDIAHRLSIWSFLMDFALHFCCGLVHLFLSHAIALPDGFCIVFSLLASCESSNTFVIVWELCEDSKMR